MPKTDVKYKYFWYYFVDLASFVFFVKTTSEQFSKKPLKHLQLPIKETKSNQVQSYNFATFPARLVL
jgi:hypothetical protein